MLFLLKLSLMLKNKLFIIKKIFNSRKTILFKIIIQKIILSLTREGDDSINSQHKSN